MEKAPTDGSEPARILIVDDEPLLLRSLRRILEADEHRCSSSAIPLSSTGRSRTPGSTSSSSTS
jgi:hypothetical protein